MVYVCGFFGQTLIVIIPYHNFCPNQEGREFQPFREENKRDLFPTENNTKLAAKSQFFLPSFLTLSEDTNWLVFRGSHIADGIVCSFIARTLQSLQYK